MFRSFTGERGALATAVPSLKGEAVRLGQRLLKPLRQVIESNRSARPSRPSPTSNVTPPAISTGVAARVLQRLLALTAVICHNEQSLKPTLRSLTAYDH